MPAYHTPAFRVENAEGFILSTDYCSIFNVLKYPAGVIPVTTV